MRKHSRWQQLSLLQLTRSVEESLRYHDVCLVHETADSELVESYPHHNIKISHDLYSSIIL